MGPCKAPVGLLVNDVAIDEFANNEPGQVQIKNHTTFHALQRIANYYIIYSFHQAFSGIQSIAKAVSYKLYISSITLSNEFRRNSSILWQGI